MIISTKGRYGLRAMYELARTDAAGPVSIKSIAEGQSISETYLEQLFSKLRAAGLVKSIRGAQGGYLLARPAGEITVGDILKVLEGPLTPADCVTKECENAKDCYAHSIWMKIYQGINQVVESITLEDMVNEDTSERKLCAQDLERCR